MIYTKHKGLCWASSSVAMVPLGAGQILLGFVWLAIWSLFIWRAR